MEATSAGEKFSSQLTLNVGGANVDTSQIASLKFAKEVNEIGDQFPKGADVTLQVTCRVTEVKVTDRYDAHGNVSETIRRHVLRADECKIVRTEEKSYLRPVPDEADEDL